MAQSQARSSGQRRQARLTNGKPARGTWNLIAPPRRMDRRAKDSPRPDPRARSSDNRKGRSAFHASTASRTRSVDSSSSASRRARSPRSPGCPGRRSITSSVRGDSAWTLTVHFCTNLVSTLYSVSAIFGCLERKHAALRKQPIRKNPHESNRPGSRFKPNLPSSAGPRGFHQLDEILALLRGFESTHLDRQAIEKLFRVRQRRARQIMAGLEGLWPQEGRFERSGTPKQH